MSVEAYLEKAADEAKPYGTAIVSRAILRVAAAEIRMWRAYTFALGIMTVGGWIALAVEVAS